jgi:hypothetical protein
MTGRAKPFLITPFLERQANEALFQLKGCRKTPSNGIS